MKIGVMTWWRNTNYGFCGTRLADGRVNREGGRAERLEVKREA